MTNYHTGSCYIGVVGPEDANEECRDSIERIIKRPGDGGPVWHRATKGYEARQMHINKFLGSSHAWLLLLDRDMLYQPDTLERLRTHGQPYLSGYYLRRRYAPVAPVWFKLPPRGVFPLEPWLDDPARGKLHPLGASGWGCILIHRDVIEATRPLLKGEWEVIEDDMDIWPYDTFAMMDAIRGLYWLHQNDVSQEQYRTIVDKCTNTLIQEFRPLRGEKSVIGSDIRYPFFAREAGYTLLGDPDVRCGHMLNYALTPDDFSGVPAEARERIRLDTRKEVYADRRKLRANLIKMLRG